MTQDEQVRANSGADQVAAMVDERVPDAPRLRAALRVVAGGQPWSVRDLVHKTGLSRRLVLELLRRMGGDLDWDGEIVRFTGPAGAYAPLIATVRAGYPGGGDEPSETAIERMSRILERAPSAVRSLDHVPATADTVLRRALYIAREFDLARTRLLFAGDHDCTSLAFGVLGLAPGPVTVVDIDERVLGFIGAEAAVAGFPVVPLFADLRIGLPDGARGGHDVVFTDPPYTADGVGLFVARGVEGLAEPVNGRILLAYGYSESTPALGLKVQRALGDLELLFEAILPGFNRYRGAESIGSSADLYRLRPSRRTAAIAQRRAARYARTLYTQGSQAAESGPEAAGVVGAPALTAGEATRAPALTAGEATRAPALTASEVTRAPALAGGEVARAVLDRFGSRRTERADLGDDGGGAVLVGAGWPSADATPVERYLATGSPHGSQSRTTFVDLRPLFGWSLIRAGLAAGSDRVIIIAPMDAYGLRSEAEQGLFRAVLAPKYEVERMLRPFEDSGAAVIVLRRPGRHPEPPAGLEPDSRAVDRDPRAGDRDAGAVDRDARARDRDAGAVDRDSRAVAAYMWDRPHGRVGNTWREGLIDAARRRGATLTKNDARALIAGAGIPGGLSGHRLIDLSAAMLLRLRSAIAETAVSVPASLPGDATAPPGEGAG